MTLKPPHEGSFSHHSMPGLVDGNNTPRDSSSTSFSNGQGNRRSIYRRNVSRYPSSSSSSSRGSRLASHRGSSFAKRRWISDYYNNGLQSPGFRDQPVRDLPSNNNNNNKGSRGRMPSEFDQSSEMVARGPGSHFVHSDDGSGGNGGPSALSLLVTASDANSNLAGVVMVDPSTGSSVDGLVSSYSTDSEDLDDTSSSAGSSGAATSLSPASSTSLGSPGARDIVEKGPSSVFPAGHPSVFSSHGGGSKSSKLFEEFDKGKENVNRLPSNRLNDDFINTSSGVSCNKQGNYDDKDIRAELEDHSSSSSCHVYDNTPTGELDENDNCDKPLAHILSQVNSSASDLESLDNRKYRLDRVPHADEGSSRTAPLTNSSFNTSNKAAPKEQKPEACEASSGQASASAADSAADTNSSSRSRLITPNEHQVQLSEGTAAKAKADAKQGRNLSSKNTDVQLKDNTKPVGLSETSNHNGTDETGTGDCNSNQRQRSLGPESKPAVQAGAVVEGDTHGGSDSLSIDTSGVVLKRPRSYPQVSQKTLFTPIPPPSPEQSGLFQQVSGSLQPPADSTSAVDVPTTTVLTSVVSDSSRTTTTTTTTSTKSTNSDDVLSSEASSMSGKKMKRPQKMPQSNLPVARVNPQANPNVNAPGSNNPVPANPSGGLQSTVDSMHKTPQYPYYPQHPMSHHQQQQQQQHQQQAFYPTPQLYPIPPGVYMHDPMGGNTGYFAPGPLPVVFLSEPPAFCDQNFYQDGSPANYQPYLPQPGPRMPPPVCFPPDGQGTPSGPYRPTGETDNTGNNSGGAKHHSYKGHSSNVESSSSNISEKGSGSSVAASNLKGSLEQKQNASQPERPEHKTSTRNTPGNSAKKKPHKQPLLPDPLIPKLSERGSQSQAGSADAVPSNMDIQSGMYHPQQHHQYLQQQNPCQPPGHQQMMPPHHQFFLQQMAANGANSPVFHGNFVEHMGPSAASFSAHPSVNGVLIASPPPGSGLHLQGQHSTGPGDSRPSAVSATNSVSSSTSPAPDGVSSTVSFVTDSTGLVIYGPQPPAAHSPAPLCLPIISPDSTPRPSTAPAGNAGVEYHHPQQQHHPHIQQPQQQQVTHQEPAGEDQPGVTNTPAPSGLDTEDPSQQQQMPVQGGLLYIPDGSGTGYVAVEVSALQSQGEAPGAYPGLATCHPGQGGAQDISYRPQDGQPPAGDAANNRPATVRMLSSNGPPMPMPMQVPPGHMVQQIVDEHGILTHVILSPQPPGPGGPLTGGPASGSQYYTSYGSPHYGPPGPGPYPGPHHHSVPPHMHGGMGSPHGGGGPHIPSTAAPGCSSHGPGQPQAEYGASPPLNSTDDRTLRTRNRVRKKLQQRRINSNEGGYYPNNHPGPGGPRSMGGPRRNRGGGAGQGGAGMAGVNGDMNMHIEPSVAHTQCSAPTENGPLDMEEENSLIIQCLSTMPLPKVTGVEARISQIQLAPPDCDSLDLDISALKFELFLSDKGRDGNYDLVFCGKTTELTLEDLIPYTEYNLKCCAVLSEDLKGALTEPVGFRTLQCEPEAPPPPKMVQKTKTSLTLRWNATCDNGSKISTYLLEWDQGTGDNSFKEIYSGFQRQHKLQRLNVSTKYMFRLAAVNAFGKSRYSEVVGYHTSGLPPAQPDPPELAERYVYALGICWKKSSNGEDFLLQMEDESTGHGFMPVYNGQNQSFIVPDLKRNTSYKFRLSARNDAGHSQWSQTVCYSTKPERPHPPSKPQIKGKINPYSFRITWDPPNDSGGTEITKYIVELDDGQGYDTVYEGSEREHTFDHLRPCHTYRIRVACCSMGGRSDFSDCCVATTLPVVPGHCHSPKLHGKPKATSLHLKWGYPDYDGGAQVSSFAVQMISSDNSTKEVFKGHDRACIVGGLLPGRSYLFQVQAFNRAGAGPWSEALEVVSGAGVPEAPRMPQVTCRSPHSAFVAWDEPFNNGALVSEYRLEWQQRTDTVEFSQLYLGPNMSFDVKGLTPATMYTFRVQAINSAGAGQFSPVAQFQTPASSPGPIASIKVVPGATWATLSWRQPHTNGSDITSYNIDVSDRATPLSVDPVAEYLLEGLQPETSYKIRVQAVNSIGVGPYSNSVKMTTRALPPAPPRLDCVMLAPSSLKLKWGEGRHSDLLTYTLEMEKEDGSFQPVYTGPAHTHKVTRLTELTTYEFRIFASNEAGGGPYSDTYSFTTTKAPPPPLKAPKVSNLSQHGCTLEWQSGKPQGGDSTAYILQLLCLNGRDTEYKQVYRGPNTSFQLDDLTAHTEYQARVAAVRLSSDQSGDITGVFSPGVVFSLMASEPSGHQSSSLTGSAGSASSSAEERRPWTDQQWAAVILLGFLLVAVVSAYACHILVTYMGGESSNQFSSSQSSGGSAPPSSSGHHRGNHHGGRGFS